MQFFLLLAFLFTLVFVIIALQNTTLVNLKFINWTFSGSLPFVLALVFAAGILSGIFLFIPTWWRKAKTAREQKKRIQELEREILTTVEQIDEPDSGEG
jgi:uncharacterized integral membrane protein